VRIGVVLAALVIGALAASWYFRGGDKTAEAEPASQLVEFQPGEPPSEDTGPTRVTHTSGLQTTVPDTLGYEEATAAQALEQGGFRVRVMYHQVSTVREEGIVVQQLPRGGVTRRVDWIVTIVVGTLR